MEMFTSINPSCLSDLLLPVRAAPEHLEGAQPLRLRQPRRGQAADAARPPAGNGRRTQAHLPEAEEVPQETE